VAFLFTAPERVDFRELVRELAQTLRTRIELRQVGVRDETRCTGGLGPCGLPVCCASFLRDFTTVSIRMAKVQGLVPNPQKVSGLCGRLMCCLAYEQPWYAEAMKGFPKMNSMVTTPKGEGKVKELLILRGRSGSPWARECSRSFPWARSPGNGGAVPRPRPPGSPRKRVPTRPKAATKRPEAPAFPPEQTPRRKGMTPAGWFDSHAHLSREFFPEDLPEVISRAFEAGLDGILDIGSSARPEAWQEAIEVASSHPRIWAALGVHPHEADQATERTFEDLERALAHPRVVALGEVGLDFHYDLSRRDTQVRVFDRQIEIAARLGKPLILHVREPTGRPGRSFGAGPCPGPRGWCTASPKGRRSPAPGGRWAS
jgi:hypothetical protein